MRIIAGTLKGRRLLAPPGGETRVRPTADRAREALFSILGGWPQGPAVDLFAGTGAVGLEAWSRGYAPVTCVEQHPIALKCLTANLRDTEVRLMKQDALKLKADAFRDQALVFADPPYDLAAEAFRKLGPRIRAWMAPGGLLVWETDSWTTLEAPEGWSLRETRDYGAARFHFLVPVIA